MNAAPRQPMTVASPEMSAEYRRRRKVYVRTGLLSLVSFPIIALTLEATVGTNTALAIGLPVFFFGFAAFASFCYRRWTCPSCEKPFGPRHPGSRCEHCEISFRGPTRWG